MDANFNVNIPNELQENERYSFSFTLDENKKRFKLATRGFVRNSVVLTMLMLILSVELYIYYYEYAYLFMFVFAVIYGLLQLSRYIETRIKWKKSAEISIGDEDVYEIKEDKIIYLNIKDGELITKHTIPYDEISFITEDKNYILFQYNNLIFTMRKTEIPSHSSLYNHIEDIKKRLKKRNKYILAGSIISIVAISSITIATAVVDAAELYFICPAYWCYLPFIAIPTLSIIYAFILKKKNYPYVWNMIIGIVTSLVLIVCGSMQLKHINYFGDSISIVSAAEEKLGIVFPKPEYVNFYTDSSYYDYYNYCDNEKIEIIYHTFFEYNYDISDLFADSVWLDEMPDEFIMMIPNPNYYIIEDNCILYNVDTGEINKVPTESGEHRLVFISYDNNDDNVLYGEYGCITIFEYIISL